MALIVGTDTYVSVDEADAYITAQGLSPLSDPESSLARATLALDRLYAGRYLGLKQTVNQPLHWPRVASYNFTADADHYFYTVDADGNPRDFSGIPTEIKQATIELAIQLESGVDPYAQPDPLVTSESVEIDVIKTNKTYSNVGGYRVDPLYSITLILRPLLVAGGQIKYVR